MSKRYEAAYEQYRCEFAELSPEQQQIATMLNAGEENEIDGFRVAGNYEWAKRRLKAIPILAVDEMDKLKWSAWQIQHIREVIEHRHRNAARLAMRLADEAARKAGKQAAEPKRRSAQAPKVV
jgi:hypothetical protein